MTPRHSLARRRALFTAAVAACLTLTLPSPAVAGPVAQTSDDWWYAGMKVAQAHDAGFTGKGIKIAVIDDGIDPTAPIFAGANLTVNDDFVGPCPDTDPVSHGTTVTSMLISRATSGTPVDGIAPDADVTFYSRGILREEAEAAGCTAYDAVDADQRDVQAIDHAVKSGNKIISMSWSISASEGLIAALTRGLAAGVVFVGATPNTEEKQFAAFPPLYNGVVGATAVDQQLGLQKSEDGTAVESQMTTVVAPGINILTPSGTAEGGVTSAQVATGSSLATPIVSGALALAWQKHPEATGNQLIQALVSTTTAAQKGIPPATEPDGYGYGAVDLTALLAADPTTLPDKNPLMDKGINVPTQADVDALATPTASPTTDSSASATAPTKTSSSDASPNASAVPWAPILIGGSLTLIAIIIAIVLIVVFARRRTQK